MNSSGNGEDTTKRFWEGSCGIVLEPQENKATGEYFWTYRFTRAFRREGAQDFGYSDHFTERNDEAIGLLMSRAISFRRQHDATQWVRSRVQVTSPSEQ